MRLLLLLFLMTFLIPQSYGQWEKGDYSSFSQKPVPGLGDPDHYGVVTLGYRGFRKHVWEGGFGYMQLYAVPMAASGWGVNAKGVWIPSEKITGIELEGWCGAFIFIAGADLSLNSTMYMKEGDRLFALRPEVGYSILLASINYGYTATFGDRWAGITPHSVTIRFNLPVISSY